MCRALWLRVRHGEAASSSGDAGLAHLQALSGDFGRTGHQQQIVAPGPGERKHRTVEHEMMVTERPDVVQGSRCPIAPDGIAIRIEEAECREVFTAYLAQVPVDGDAGRTGELRSGEAIRGADQDVLARELVLEDLATNEKSVDVRWDFEFLHSCNLPWAPG